MLVFFLFGDRISVEQDRIYSYIHITKVLKLKIENPTSYLNLLKMCHFFVN